MQASEFPKHMNCNKNPMNKYMNPKKKSQLILCYRERERERERETHHDHKNTSKIELPLNCYQGSGVNRREKERD